MTIQYLSGLSEVAPNYDVLLCDIWGVVHNGGSLFPYVIHALTSYREMGGTVVLVSNAPRPSISILEQLLKLNLPDSTYDLIETSGNVTQTLLKTNYQGAKIFHLGPERDLSLFQGVEVQKVSYDFADLIVCTGLKDDEKETPEDYRKILESLAKRQLVMLCANPDKVVERNGKLVYCAGALSDLYEELGGQTIILGKPYAPIYGAAIQRCETLRGQSIDHKRVLAIGDSVRTDLAGAAQQGFHMLFITAGIHAEELGTAENPDPHKVQMLLQQYENTLIGYQPYLVW